MVFFKSVMLFILAGLCEIGGGYFIWMWIKNGRSIWLGLAGMLLLVLYGFIPTFQQNNFGRVYAAYGGLFIILSILWGWKIDGIAPDKLDMIGSIICLIGIAVILVPRTDI